MEREGEEKGDDQWRKGGAPDIKTNKKEKRVIRLSVKHVKTGLKPSDLM